LQPQPAKDRDLLSMGFPLKSNSVELPDRLSERNRKHPLSLLWPRHGFEPMVESGHNAAVKILRRDFLKSTAAIPNAGPFVEWSIEEDANAGEGLYSPSLEVKGGKVKIPDGPGWGVRINPGWLEKAAYLKSERPA
jgi:hypothetical protein